MRIMSRRARAVACGALMVVAGGAVGVVGLRKPQVTSAAKSYQVAGPMAMGITFDPAPDAASGQPSAPPGVGTPISKTRAVAIATKHAFGLVRQLHSGVSVEARFGTFSDSQLAKRLPTGVKQPYFQKRLAWLVTFSGPGVQILSSGPMGGTHSVNHEENIVIDGLHGLFLESFTYR